MRTLVRGVTWKKNYQGSRRCTYLDDGLFALFDDARKNSHSRALTLVSSSLRSSKDLSISALQPSDIRIHMDSLLESCLVVQEVVG